MSKLKCEINYTTSENDNGYEVDCVTATCPKCGHETVSWGQGDGSIKRCLVLLSEECPRGERNFYVEE